MKKAFSHRPSSAMVVAMVALVLAASSSAVAASRLINGDKLIKKGTLSGNRLRNHTVTATQIARGVLGAAGANWIRTGLVKATGGQTVTLASFAPFTISLKCSKFSDGNATAEIDATSTEAGSEAYNIDMPTAGKSYATNVSETDKAADESTNNAADFFAPSGKTYIADLTAGVHRFGADCYADALVSPS